MERSNVSKERQMPVEGDMRTLGGGQLDEVNIENREGCSEGVVDTGEYEIQSILHQSNNEVSEGAAGSLSGRQSRKHSLRSKSHAGGSLVSRQNSSRLSCDTNNEAGSLRMRQSRNYSSRCNATGSPRGRQGRSNSSDDIYYAEGSPRCGQSRDNNQHANKTYYAEGSPKCGQSRDINQYANSSMAEGSLIRKQSRRRSFNDAIDSSTDSSIDLPRKRRKVVQRVTHDLTVNEGISRRRRLVGLRPSRFIGQTLCSDDSVNADNDRSSATKSNKYSFQSRYDSKSLVKRRYEHNRHHPHLLRSRNDDQHDPSGSRNRRYNYNSNHDNELSNRVSSSPTGRKHVKSRTGTKITNTTDDTNSVLDKFLEILKTVKGSSTSKLSLCNVVPEFDPMVKEQTILTWLTKVEECAEIYGWDERETIHYALPKLTGIAKSWYQALDTVLYSWGEWKRKLIETFPCRDDYAELLINMLSKKVKYGDSLEHYFYEKINLLNRCDIKGRKAVDCILNGIEDRAIRVGAQAAQFREPEEVLKYLKTVKIGISRDTNDRRDKLRQDRKPAMQLTLHNRKVMPIRKIVCHNCSDEGHKSFECKKPPVTCNACNRVGHANAFCRFNKQTSSYSYKDRANNSTDNAKTEEKQVSELLTPSDSNKKYVFEILVNNEKLLCHVDLGSQCTLIRESDAERLNMKFDYEGLPLMRGIGGHHVKPLGRCSADVVVQGIHEYIEIFVVHDNVLSYPVLLGHTFTEKPNIIITKTPNEILFEKTNYTKLFMRVQTDVTLVPNLISVVTVNSHHAKFTGQIYVNGSIRGDANQEYYLLPGEYFVKSGVGRVLIMNMSEQNITLAKSVLITRATPIVASIDVSLVSFDDDHLDDTIQYGTLLSVSEKSKLKALLTKYNDCFSSGLKDLGVTTAGEMVIQLENTEPVVYRPYRMSHTERTLVRDMIDEMLDAEIIRESSSPYASPIVLVRKKTGEKRLCVDYRALNKRTRKDHYPLPRVEDQLDRLAGNNLFISLDLASGYYQIPISPESQEKTAFVTPDGQYEYIRMPFGLANAPSVFQRTMNKILLEAKIKYALIYMDDILIPAKTFEEGLERLEEVLGLLKSGGLTLKLAKCHFFFDKIDFLGFEVSSEGIKPGARKTDAVAKFPVPKNVHELRQFIGLASFFRRFVRGFAVIAKPLTDLLGKGAEWRWGVEQNDAIDVLKSSLICRPILALYDPKRETQVHTDASKYGVAGILLQKCDEGSFKPVSYFSRKTTPDEQKLHSYDLETLAVVASLNRFRIYLIGIPFKVLTDCNALRTTMTKRDLIPRIARWWIQIQEFDCEIEYRPGNRMAHADALSRNPVDEASTEEHVLDVLTLNEEDWIVTVQSSDDEISRIKKILSDPESVNVAEIVKNYKLKNGKVFRLIDAEGEQLRWVVPKGVRWQVAKMNHDDIGHFGFEKTLARVRQSFWFPKMRRFLKKYVQSCLECAHHKGVTGKQQGELHPIPRAEIPFHTIHMDHLGPFVRSSRGNCYILVIIDGFTKFINVTAVRNTKTATTLKVLREHISYFGAPTRIITDRGTSFTSKSFRECMKSLGIKHILNAVATPRANGQVERFNRTILDTLSAKCHGTDDKKWDDFVPDVQFGINSTVHKVTGKSPSEILFGFRLKGGSENILSEVIDETVEKMSPQELGDVRTEVGKRINDQQIKDKEVFDAKRRPAQQFNTGDLVNVRRDIPNNDGKSKKLLMKYQGPYRVIKVLPNDRYLIEDTPLTRKGGKRYENIIASDKLKPWLSFNKDFDSDSSESENTDNNSSPLDITSVSH